jgi:cyclophilin family peptidyl-prolyl cis-trans isomerase
MAAQAAESVGAQAGTEAYWQYVTLLTDSTAAWAGASEDELAGLLAGYAAEAGADADQVQADLDAGMYQQTVEETAALVDEIGVVAPNILANDLPIGVQNPTPEVMNQIIEVMMLRVTYHTAPEQVVDSAKQYVAWIVTEKGTISVNLLADRAPQTVNNFIYLACSGYYSGVTFHRVLPGFVAQAGDPTGLGFGGPGYTIPDENEGSELVFDKAGWLSMARTSEPNSARGQFFITLGPAEHLNADFTIFGEVLDGQDVAESLTPRDPQSNPGAPPGDVIEEIVVREVE